MTSISEREFRQLADYIKQNYGIKLGPEKKSLVIGRLCNVLAQKNIDNFDEYYRYLVTDRTGEAALTLIDRITTNHTFFMREPEHFYYFRDVVLPYLAATVKDKDLRIWSAGCASGQEPYTLAMLLADWCGVGKPGWNTAVLATDISGKALTHAVEGVYPDSDIAPLPVNWRRSYFQKFDVLNSVVTDKIKNQVVFRKFNLMEMLFPFKKKFHVIFCRNVMIYFDSSTKAELINRFYDNTEPGGYLFISHSESLNREETRYKYIRPAVYRKEVAAGK